MLCAESVTVLWGNDSERMSFEVSLQPYDLHCCLVTMLLTKSSGLGNTFYPVQQRYVMFTDEFRFELSDARDWQHVFCWYWGRSVDNCVVKWVPYNRDIMLQLGYASSHSSVVVILLQADMTNVKIKLWIKIKLWTSTLRHFYNPWIQGRTTHAFI